jgi:hypothetical protein
MEKKHFNTDRNSYTIYAFFLIPYVYVTYIIHMYLYTHMYINLFMYGIYI